MEWYYLCAHTHFKKMHKNKIFSFFLWFFKNKFKKIAQKFAYENTKHNSIGSHGSFD